MCQLCPSTMARGQEPGGHQGSRAAPSESGAHSARMAFFPDKRSVGAPGAGEAPGSHGRGGEGVSRLPWARPAQGTGARGLEPARGLGLDLDSPSGCMLPTMPGSPVRTSREQVWPLEHLFTIPEGKWNSPLRFWGEPLRTFSVL